MALIPLKQSVTIKRKGATDGWNNEITPATTFTLKCRIEEGAKLTRRTTYQQGTTQILAEEVVSSAQIYFDKFADVKLTDEILYADESGHTRTYLPLNINHIRGLNGKTLMTEVEV
jgi:hypothetical protein